MVPRPLAPALAMKSHTCADVFQPCRGRVNPDILESDRREKRVQSLTEQ